MKGNSPQNTVKPWYIPGLPNSQSKCKDLRLTWEIQFESAHWPTQPVKVCWLSRFLTPHQHHLGYIVPLLGKIKQWRCLRPTLSKFYIGFPRHPTWMLLRRL